MKRTKREVADIIDSFLSGEGEEWDWDDFTSIPIHDPELNRIRLRCVQLDKEFPPEKRGEYCNAHGMDVLRDYVKRLRTK